MELIYGTKNKAKLEQLKGALAKLPIEIIGLPHRDLPDVEEDGKTAQENARKKATTYARILNTPVLSMDIALYFDGLVEEKQPGIFVRRFAGKERATDDEVFDYYSAIVKQLGERVGGRWEYFVCVAYPDGKVFETIVVTPRIFVSSASPVRIEGYPLEAIQIDPDSGKYISEMKSQEQDEYWQKTIGKELCDFINKYISNG